MCVAGVFASIAPAQAAAGPAGTATLVLTNQAGTEGHFALENHLIDQPLLFVVTSSTKGAHNVTVPAGGTTNASFQSDWGTIVVQYLSPIDELWHELGRYTVPTISPTPTPTPTVTETATPLPDDTATKMIGFCHATHPRAEAYLYKYVSVSAFLNEGHGSHEGDITPPFTYVKQGVQGSYPGNRWDEAGIAIFNNHCTVIPLPSPTPTETETATPTPTETETAEPTPTASETATASPSPTSSATATHSPTATNTPSSTGTTSQAPAQTTKVTPSESAVAIATTNVSRYPAAYVDTAVVGESQATPAPFLFVGAALIALLSGLLLRGESQAENRRH